MIDDEVDLDLSQTCFNVFNYLGRRDQLFVIGIGYFVTKGVFELNDDLDLIQAVQTQILHQMTRKGYLETKNQ